MLTAIRRLIASLSMVLCLYACHEKKYVSGLSENGVPSAWADLSLYIAKNTPANSPTFASRGFGYIGLTMYEAVVCGFPAYHSLAGQLNQLNKLPLPDKNKSYSWVLSLNAAEAFILRSIYIQTSNENKLKIDSLENVIYHFVADTIEDKQIALRSVAYGRAVASAIFAWSKSDGGHRGYLSNFDSKMFYPNGKGSWKPPFFAQQITRLPLHPHWGDNRTFLIADTNWKMPDFIPYDTLNNSNCFNQSMLVYQTNKKITREQKEIAMWWNDDPSETYTPPGHSYNLASIVVRNKKASMIKAAQTYARVGMAVADAFIVCWRIKYKFYTERPSTFVNEHIDSEWNPFWPDPPFPAFPSGHATQAAAAATVFAGLYGDSIVFTDNSHVGRPRDKVKEVDYKPRKFTSFWQVAEETAYSRFLGGIHTMQDNQVGLNEGAKIGHHINELQWTN
jgi:hypothetical protein